MLEYHLEFGYMFRADYQSVFKVWLWKMKIDSSLFIRRFHNVALISREDGRVTFPLFIFGSWWKLSTQRLTSTCYLSGRCCGLCLIYNKFAKDSSQTNHIAYSSLERGTFDGPDAQLKSFLCSWDGGSFLWVLNSCRGLSGVTETKLFETGVFESWTCALCSCQSLCLGITKLGFLHLGQTFVRSLENHCFQNPCLWNPRCVIVFPWVRSFQSLGFPLLEKNHPPESRST